MLFWDSHKKFRKEKHIEKTKIKHRHTPKSIDRKTKRAVLSASMTVEAAFIVPLFLFFSVILVFVINLINFQNRINEAMYDVSRTLSKLEYNVSGSANSATAMGMLYMNLNKELVQDMGVMGGRWGITLLSSDFEDDMVDFAVNYTIKVPFDFLGIVNLNCSQRMCVRKWIGNEDKGEKDDNHGNTAGRMVYITETGTVYHTNRNCTHLVLTKKSISQEELKNLRNAGGGKYYGCELCVGKSIPETVYITDWGDKYHADGNCSGLKRGVLTVPLDEVAGWPMCSRCGG